MQSWHYHIVEYGKTSLTGHLEYLFPFSDWKWERKCQLFDASIFNPIFQSENGSQCKTMPQI